MEDLNKTQLVLLCLLVSFVTSISTGIITFSLLEEAPQTVTQTINRVVERTVEKVVPQQSGPPLKEVTTVVVKEEDLVVDAIKKSSQSLVRISDNVLGGGQVRAIGMVVSNKGVILTDKGSILENGSYNATFFDGRSFSLRIVDGGSSNTIFLQPNGDTGDYKFFPAETANSDGIQLGQTVIALGGKESNSVAIGRIKALNEGNTGTTTKITNVEIDVPLNDLIPGSLLLNLSGQIIGIEDYDFVTGQENDYLAISPIRTASLSLFDAQ